MKKRLLAFIVFMSVLFMTFPAFADGTAEKITGSCGKNLTYEYDPSLKTLTISGTGEMWNYYSNRITGPVAPWYDFCENIVSVSIETGVTNIGDFAFYYCKGLTNITIPDSVKTIGGSAFCECEALTSITIPGGIINIREDTFQNCIGLTSVIIPGSVKNIDNHAFDGCSNLTSIIIPEGVKSIGEYAFSYCSNLESITIPDSVTSIGGYAFVSTAYYNDNSKWENDVLYIGNHLIKADYWTFTKKIEDGSVSDTYAVRPGTKTIADCAFESCGGLKGITIPESVTHIGNKAFQSCNGLTGITIPKSVTSIGDGAFYKCSSLTNVSIDKSNTAYCSENDILYDIGKTKLMFYPSIKTDTSFAIPKGVKSIGFGAFSDCTALTSVTIPYGVKTIGDYAFYSCKGLTSIIIPDGVKSIGGYAFQSCIALKSVTIPNSVTSIGDSAFNLCDALTEVNYNGAPEDWTHIDKGDSYLNNESIVKYRPGIWITRFDDGRIVAEPLNIESGKTVILALYDGDKLVEMQQSGKYSETNKEITFTPTKAYTRAKVMIWESLSGMSPVCGIKILE